MEVRLLKSCTGILDLTSPPETGPGVVLVFGRLDPLKGAIPMSQRRYTPEQIINKLRQAEVEISNGATIPIASKKIGVTEQTYYRWRSQYGGMRVDQAKRFKELEKENVQLKKVVADQALDISILKEAASGNF